MGQSPKTVPLRSRFLRDVLTPSNGSPPAVLPRSADVCIDLTVSSIACMSSFDRTHFLSTHTFSFVNLPFLCQLLTVRLDINTSPRPELVFAPASLIRAPPLSLNADPACLIPFCLRPVWQVCFQIGFLSPPPIVAAAETAAPPMFYLPPILPAFHGG